MSLLRPALTWLLIWLLAFAAPAQAVQNMLLLEAALGARAAKTGLIRDQVSDHNGDYGETLTEQGTVYNPFRWNGEQLDAESGLYYLRNRYYQPSTGRFMQRDPIGYEGGLNLYAYCGGDPIQGSDPSGLDPWAEQAAKDLRQFRQEYHLPYATLERMYLQEAWENSAEGQGVLYQRLRGRAAVSGFVFRGAVSTGTPRVGGYPSESYTSSLVRLSQDVNVNPVPPPALRLNRLIGTSLTQNAKLQSMIQSLQAQGAFDIRVNQQQVNFEGVRVGTGRPDLQYSLGQSRNYVELDRPGSGRGPGHMTRLISNDPTGNVELLTVP